LDDDLRAKIDDSYAWVLSYYEHGEGCWSLKGEGMQCRWDTARVAGLLVWEDEPTGLGGKTVLERDEQARSFLENYNEWANGHTYYSLEVDGEDIAGCGGFTGDDHLMSGLREACREEDVEITEAEGGPVPDGAHGTG